MPDRPPNLVLLITDQQRAPQHWPEDPSWLDELTPNDAELRRTGMSFTRAFTATAMCSPSRASFLTGKFPSRHGVTLTHTEGDLFPDAHNLPDVIRTVAGLMLSGEAPRGRVARAFGRGLLRLGPKSGNEPELPAGIDTLATLLRERGYHVALKGKWHLPSRSTAASGVSRTRSASSAITASRTGSRPTPAATQRPRRSAAAAPAPPRRAGTRTTRGRWKPGSHRRTSPSPSAWSSHSSTRTTFWAIPSSYERGGYAADEFRGLGVPLPPTVEEDLRDKPTVQSLMKLGQTSYIGALNGRREQQDYVDFYAHLHRVVDEKIGRLLTALGDPRDPGVTALPNGDRADVRPRGAGPLARRAAPEDVQCLRGDDPGAAGRLEPSPVPGGARERRARVTGRSRPDVPRAGGRSAPARAVRRARPRAAAARGGGPTSRRGAVHL